MVDQEQVSLSSFDTTGAIACARTGRLEEWIHTYLTSGPWANMPFSDGLKRQNRWWAGPIEVPLASLRRALGPEPDREYVVSINSWLERIIPIAESLSDPLAVPPLIVEYRGGHLSVRDGNHRHGAMQRAGWATCWAVIWHNSEEEYQAHSNDL